MRILGIVILFIWGGFAFAQSAVVDVTLTPAGSFKIKSSDVRGVVQKKDGGFEAKNILVGLKNLQTGISLRDTHTKKHLEVDKFPDAILVSAKGKNGKGEGVVKIKGIEQKIKGTFNVDGDKLIATFRLKLSDFNIKDIKYMSVGVDDEVTVTITLPIH